MVRGRRLCCESGVWARGQDPDPRVAVRVAIGGGGVGGPWGVPLNPRTRRGGEVSGLPPLSRLTGVAPTQPLSH